MLKEIPFDCVHGPVPQRAARLITTGLRDSRKIDCFEFVPSNYNLVYSVLSALPRTKLCEWGSGIGVVTGLAEILGFETIGIEINEPMVLASRQLLADFELKSPIVLGSFFDEMVDSAYYFTYSWPGMIAQVEEFFYQQAPDDSILITCYGCDDIHFLVKDRD